MKNEVRFSLVGCGRVSTNHLDAIHNAQHATLVAVCDIIAEKAKRVAEENNLEKYYTDVV